jgi:hypothetical protein
MSKYSDEDIDKLVNYARVMDRYEKRMVSYKFPDPNVMSIEEQTKVVKEHNHDIETYNKARSCLYRHVAKMIGKEPYNRIDWRSPFRKTKD